MSKYRSGFGGGESSDEKGPAQEQRTQLGSTTQEAMPDTGSSIDMGGLAGDVSLGRIVVLPILRGGDAEFRSHKLWLGRFATSAPLQSALSRLCSIIQPHGGNMRLHKGEGADYFRFEYLSLRDKVSIAHGYKRSASTRSADRIYSKLASHVTAYEAPGQLNLKMPIGTFLAISVARKREDALHLRGKVGAADTSITQMIVDKVNPVANTRRRSPDISVNFGVIERAKSSEPPYIFREMIRNEVRAVTDQISLEIGP
jgi:hypothetical protein